MLEDILQERKVLQQSLVVEVVLIAVEEEEVIVVEVVGFVDDACEIGVADEQVVEVMRMRTSDFDFDFELDFGCCCWGFHDASSTFVVDVPDTVGIKIFLVELSVQVRDVVDVDFVDWYQFYDLKVEGRDHHQELWRWRLRRRICLYLKRELVSVVVDDEDW